jgi:8-hydroxy-5-deazaflavin:NADPH oxidoreductase
MEDLMKVGIIGSGLAGRALAKGFLKYGHDVVIGTRTPSQLDEWVAENPAARVASVSDAAEFGEVVVLVVKGTGAADALRNARAENLSGKCVIDVTNPIADAPPTNGVLKYFTSLDESLMERLQAEYPDARFVKAFNSTGNRFFVNPQFADGKPSMFICGNDEAAKKTVTGILDQFGWKTADMGGVESARAIEPLCMLWCIQGFLHNDWGHSFKWLS